jgi:hypothetical protein
MHILRNGCSPVRPTDTYTRAGQERGVLPGFFRRGWEVYSARRLLQEGEWNLTTVTS